MYNLHETFPSVTYPATAKTIARQVARKVILKKKKRKEKKKRWGNDSKRRLIWVLKDRRDRSHDNIHIFVHARPHDSQTLPLPLIKALS